jgi:hypothetical protein
MKILQAPNQGLDDLSQKRKHEDGETHSKRNRLGNSELEPEGRKKRKKEDLENSPLKRRRVGNRDSTRVKEHPAGNVATSASRKAFLQSLCACPEFLTLVDMIPAVVRCLHFREFNYMIFNFQF